MEFRDYKFKKNQKTYHVVELNCNELNIHNSEKLNKSIDEYFNPRLNNHFGKENYCLDIRTIEDIGPSGFALIKKFSSKTKNFTNSKPSLIYNSQNENLENALNLLQIENHFNIVKSLDDL